MAYASGPVGSTPPPPPLPFYGEQWGAGWAGPPGAGTREAVRELKKSILFYQIHLVLILLFTLVAVGLLGSVVLGSAGSFLAPASTNPSAPTAAGSGSALAGIALVGVLLLAALIFLLPAWITWLGGSNKLAQHAGEFGPQAANSARTARSDWTRTTAVWFINLLVGIVIAVVIVVALLSSLGPLTNRTATSTPPSLDLSHVIGLVVVASVISAVFTFLLYWFATRGLAGGLNAIASPEIQGETESARKIILVGAILSVAGGAGYLVPIVRLAALISPVLLVYGFWRLGGAYDRWLAQPPTPRLSAPSAPVSARPYG